MNFKKTWKRFMNMSRSREGFTLVELIVVIAILAILAGVAVPVYSGYIKKANEAADQQLLAAVNTAFGAACVENNTDVYSIESASLTLQGAEGAKKIASVSPYNESFFRYFAGNENATFKTANVIMFDTNKRVFVIVGEGDSVTTTYRGNTVVISGDAVAALQNSTWGQELTADELLDLVTDVTGLASALDNSTYAALLQTPAYAEAAAAVLGTDDFQAKVMELTMAEFDAWYAENPDATLDQQNAKRAEIGQSIMTNTTVLVAAKNAQAASADIMNVLTSGTGKSTIVSTMSSDPTTGLAQAALAYGMYTSYAYSTGLAEPGTAMDLADVMNALQSEGEDDEDFNAFKTYLDSPQGQKDMEGYLAALNTVSNNPGAASQVVVNGFDDAELSKLLGQVMG